MMGFVKKYFVVFLFSATAILFGLAGFRYMKGGNGMTHVVVREELVNVGEVKYMSDVKTSFVLENTGKHDLKILKAVPDCECVVAGVDKSSIPPGQSAEVHVEYHGRVTGHFQHTISVYVNTENSPIVLILRGKAIS